MKQGELIAIGGVYVDINVPNFPLAESGLQLETEVVGQEYQVEPGGLAVNFARLCSTLEIPTTFIDKGDMPGKGLYAARDFTVDDALNVTEVSR